VDSATDTTIIDAAILLAVVAFGTVCWYLRLSYRISVVAGLVLLVVAAVSDTVGQVHAGNLVAIMAYYALAVGVALAIVEWRREDRAVRAAVDPSEGIRTEKATPSRSSALRFRRLSAYWKRLHR
jgi:ABC-type proline/glycine betaine transport system permease subunit